MPSPTDDLRSLLGNAPTSGARPGTRPPVGAGTNNAGRRANDGRTARPPDRAAPPSNRVSPAGADRRRPTPPPAPLPIDEVAVTDIVDLATQDQTPSVAPQPQQTSSPMALGGRPSSTLQKAWIDPEETPFEPVARPGNPLAARLISWVFVAALLAGLGWLVIPELDLRLQSLNSLELRQGVLSAQPVQLSPLRPAVVSELYVNASSLPDGVLPKGSAVALLEGTSQDGKRRETSEMQVPFDARFVSVDTLVGGIVMPGTPVATVYDPSQMYVIFTVQPELLDIIRRGMTVRLISDVAGVEISGEVISAVPLLGTEHEPTTANLVNIRIKPDPEGVADLVPGLRFDAIIDLTSAAPDAQPLVFTFAGHVSSDGTAKDTSPSGDTTADGTTGNG